MDGSTPDNRGFGMEAALRGLAARGYRPQVVYDIGAADGGWTRMALRHWPASRFVCFEPLAERQAALVALAAERPGQVEVRACGLGDADGELSLGVTDFLWDSSFAYAGRIARTVPVRRLDSLVAAGLPRPDFLKIDVQGFEVRVVRGGRDSVIAADLVLMECAFFPFCPEMRSLDRTVAIMAELGFVPYEFVDFLRRPLDGAMGQCDLLFARRDHPLVSRTSWA